LLVTYSNIIGNDSGVTRIVFRNIHFDFSNKICTDIGSLGVDTSL
jgi:hypothetical protein